MTTKTQIIEVDSDTASVLQARAAARGVSVSEVVAELVPLAIDDEDVAELDRRWAKVAAGGGTVPHEEIEEWLRGWGTPGFRRWHNFAVITGPAR
jgi:predicted transcriptional regulator